MNPAQLHLVFTHLPIVGLGFAVIFNIIAIVRKSEELRKLSLWFYLLIGFFALPAYITGDDAGKLLETYPGITKDFIEYHENIALFFFIGLMFIAALSATALYITKTRANLLKQFSMYLLFAALLVSILAVLTGSSGGAIRHTEVKQGEYKKLN